MYHEYSSSLMDSMRSKGVTGMKFGFLGGLILGAAMVVGTILTGGALPVILGSAAMAFAGAVHLGLAGGLIGAAVGAAGKAFGAVKNSLNRHKHSPEDDMPMPEQMDMQQPQPQQQQQPDMPPVMTPQQQQQPQAPQQQQLSEAQIRAMIAESQQQGGSTGQIPFPQQPQQAATPAQPRRIAAEAVESAVGEVASLTKQLQGLTQNLQSLGLGGGEDLGNVSSAPAPDNEEAWREAAMRPTTPAQPGPNVPAGAGATRTGGRE